jgi:hypothetical protein
VNFDDIFRQQGVNIQNTPQPTGPVQFGPLPTGTIMDNSQSPLWNILNNRTRSAGEVFGTNQQWNPDQYNNSAQRFEAWNALGRPSTDYMGRTVTGQDGGGVMTWNGQALNPNNNAFGQSLGMSGGQPQYNPYAPTPQQSQQQYAQTSQPFIPFQQNYAQTSQPFVPRGASQGGFSQSGYDFSNPMNYSGYGNWNQPRQQGKGRGY